MMTGVSSWGWEAHLEGSQWSKHKTPGIFKLDRTDSGASSSEHFSGGCEGHHLCAALFLLFILCRLPSPIPHLEPEKEAATYLMLGQKDIIFYLEVSKHFRRLEVLFALLR